MSLSLLYIMFYNTITVLSDPPSLERECNVTGQPIWFRPLKLNFQQVSVLWLLSMAWSDAVWEFGRRTVGCGQWSGWWLKAVTEYFWHHIFTEVTRAREKSQLLYAGCVSFTVYWLFWNLHGSYMSPRPLLSWNKPGNFSFENMGPLISPNSLEIYWVT